MPGVEVHAQLLEAALTDAPRRAGLRGGPRDEYGRSWAGLAILALRPSPACSPFLPSVLADGWGNHRGLLACLQPAIRCCSTASFPVLASSFRLHERGGDRLFPEQIDRRRIRSAFGQYLSPTLVERLAKSSKELVLGGKTHHDGHVQRRAGFHRHFRKLQGQPAWAHHVDEQVSHPVTNAIIARNGTIDKYMGDAVMAFWNRRWTTQPRRAMRAMPRSICWNASS